MIKAIAVVIKFGFGIKIFCREAVVEEVGEGTELGDGVTEGIVGVSGDRVAVCINVLRYVAVVVVARNMKLLSGGIRMSFITLTHLDSL